MCANILSDNYGLYVLSETHNVLTISLELEEPDEQRLGAQAYQSTRYPLSLVDPTGEITASYAPYLAFHPRLPQAPPKNRFIIC